MTIATSVGECEDQSHECTVIFKNVNASASLTQQRLGPGNQNVERAPQYNALVEF